MKARGGCCRTAFEGAGVFKINMEYIAKIINLIMDIVLVPAGKTHHAFGLAWLSVLTGIGMAYVFKATSSQQRIKAAKNRFKARILEMRIYQDDLFSILAAFFGSLRANLWYLSLTLKPLFIMIVPVIIIFMQMDERYARVNFSPGDETILSVRLAGGSDPMSDAVTFECGEGVSVAAGPVRIPKLGEIDWRLRIDSPGTHTLTLSAGGETYRIPVIAEKSHRFVGAHRQASSVIEPLLHPGLPPIPQGSAIEAVRIEYPGTSYAFLYWHFHWIVIFVIYSLLGALAMKRLIGFEI